MNVQTPGARFVHALAVYLRGAGEGRSAEIGVEAVNEAAWRLVAAVGELDLTFGPTKVRVNGITLRLPEGLSGSRASLAENLHGRGVGGLGIRGVAEHRDWLRFLRVLSTAERGQAGSFDASEALNERLGDSSLCFLPAPGPAELATDPVTAPLDLEALHSRPEAAWAVGVYMEALLAVQALLEGRDGDPSRSARRLVELVLQGLHAPLALVAMRTGVPYRLRHPVNTALLGVALGHRLGLDRRSLLELGLCALACDVGMSEVPEAILRKSTPLEPDELEQIRRHPLYSAHRATLGQRLDRAQRRRIVVCLEQHLERDGGGYPQLVAWPRPLLFSRILALADSYDAMVSDKPWRRGLLPDRALARLAAESGRRVDPALLAVFVRLLGRYPLGSVVMLSTGQVGLVIEAPEEGADGLRPRLRALFDERGQPMESTIDLREKSPLGLYRATILTALHPEELGLDLLELLFEEP